MIKLLICDLDGTLTDGCYFVFSGNEGICKKFNTRDFHGLNLLVKTGVDIAVVTSARSSITEKQFRRSIPAASIFVGVTDKLSKVREEFIERDRSPKPNYKWDDIAFIGDDLPDKTLLAEVGIAACPCDAEPEILEVVRSRQDGFVMDRKGGDACVREFTDLIRRLNEDCIMIEKGNT